MSAFARDGFSDLAASNTDTHRAAISWLKYQLAECYARARGRNHHSKYAVGDRLKP
jgi:hypothetical protein